MLLEVLKYPDPRLRNKAKPVDKVTPELQKLADDMLETMYQERGIGLAAIQVGRDVRLLVMDTRPKENGRYKMDDMTELEQQVAQPIIIFNPVLKKKQGKTTFDEGCLSVPTYFETVERADYIEVEGLGRDGKPFTIKTDGLVAICLQHEMDHLDGKLFIDRLSLIKSNRIKSKIKKYGYPDRKANENDEDPEEEEAAL
jgi:peptide deformylase